MRGFCAGVLVAVAAAVLVVAIAMAMTTRPDRAAVLPPCSVRTSHPAGGVPTLAPPRPRSVATADDPLTRNRRSAAVYVTVEVESADRHAAGR
jgi:hypothetical protein